MIRLLLVLLFAASCGGSKPKPIAKSIRSKLDADAVAGVKAPKLVSLLREHWRLRMSRSPIWATQLGYEIYRREIGDNSEQARKAYYKEVDQLLKRGQALAKEWKSASGISAGDRLTLALFLEELQTNQKNRVCQFAKWSISARDNPVSSFNYLPEAHTITSRHDADNLLARYDKIPRYIEQSIANLKQGIAEGMVADKETIGRTITLIEAELAKPTAEMGIMRATENFPENWHPNRNKVYLARFQQTVANEIRPAFARYLAFLQTELLPKARAEGGLAGLPQGKDCYAARIVTFTDRAREPVKMHKLGLLELEKIHEEMRKLGKQEFGVQTLAEVFHKLRTDKALYYDTPEAIMEDAEAIVDEARAKLSYYFAELPKAKVVVKPVPDYEAPFTTIAYYRSPKPDGSRPGEYFINTYKPEVRPRYEMRALSFHEAIPGHHLQIAIAQQQGGLPAFRKYGGYTSFVEGWALYTERLADEMQLYPKTTDKLGMLSYDAWRASRLVVDTGIHAMGWPRARAEQFMTENVALTKENIRNEVDRYINTPGQALAYKIGQLEILKTRTRAQKELGDKFDIGQFHRALLEQGAISMAVMENQIDRWIKITKAK